MTKRTFLGNWYAGMSIAGLIVAVVAGLLLTIIGVARSILKNATHALGVANEIVSNTGPIWDLETTNNVAGDLLKGARAIEQHASQIADALETPAPTPG